MHGSVGVTDACDEIVTVEDSLLQDDMLAVAADLYCHQSCII